MIINWIFKNEVEGMDWIDVAKDGDRWQAVVNAVGFHKMRRIF
jgi:hypothetical protein